MAQITQDRLKELFHYNEVTGIFTRKTHGKRDITHVDSNGYISGFIDGKKRRVHRMAWIYSHGECALGMEVDHINRDKTDNRISNLRVATKSQNQTNSPKQLSNKSGRKGVCWHKASGKWISQISYAGKVIYLGLYKTIDEAYVVYCKENTKLNGEYACN